MRFGDRREAYQAAKAGAALFDRGDRGLIELVGADRRTWLHNLVTNEVKDLEPGTGCYAFATDVKARIVFDCNVLCRNDALWLDLDRAVAATAMAHLDQRLIMEDVAMRDRSDDFARVACCGPEAVRVAAGAGVNALGGMSEFAGAEVADGAYLFRHDFAGDVGFELIVPRERASAWWDRMVGFGAKPAGYEVLDLLRTEAGIPWLGRDLDEQVLPPETGQGGRGISYQKGCYLGQEVIERMRSRGVLARQLVRIELGGDEGALSVPTAIRLDDREVGRVTTLVRTADEDAWVGLGYVRAAVLDRSGFVAGAPARAIRVKAL